MILRPYQQQVARAVLDSITEHRGLTFSVEVARQGGKNELSAHLELLLLTLHMAEGGTLIKCSPTFKPQTVISMNRLRDRLVDYGFEGVYRLDMGYIIHLGAASAVFLSAEESSNVVGHTASILLEVDESQDVSKEKYTKDFRPMGSSTNVTTVHYGTTWDDTTLLEEMKQHNLELERKDGIRRHFRFDWQEVAKYNPDYLAYVESERERLGEDHPLFRTQYALLPVPGGGRLLTRQQVITLTGLHPRDSTPRPDGRYVLGIDLAGEHDIDHDILVSPAARQDSTVVTVGQLHDTPSATRHARLPALRVVEQYEWRGTPHTQLYGQLVDIARRWRPGAIAVDATGIGQPVASFLRQELGPVVHPFVFTQASKSQLGFLFLEAVNGGRLQLYLQDDSHDYRETMFQLQYARAEYRPNQTMTFYVDPSQGHDDYLMSLALTVWAAGEFAPRTARGGDRNDD